MAVMVRSTAATRRGAPRATWARTMSFIGRPGVDASTMPCGRFLAMRDAAASTSSPPSLWPSSAVA